MNLLHLRSDADDCRIMSSESDMALVLWFHRAKELEEDIRTIRGGDEAATLRRLEDSFKKLKAAYKEVQSLAQGAEEAAAKCQV